MHKMFHLALVVAAGATAIRLPCSAAQLAAAAFEDACLTEAESEECSVSLRQLRVRHSSIDVQTNTIHATAPVEAIDAEPHELDAASTVDFQTSSRRRRQSTTLRPDDEEDDDDDGEETSQEEHERAHRDRTPEDLSTRRRKRKSPPDEPVRSSCQCWWATRTSCARNDGSLCWDTCCRNPVWCDCSWTHGGEHCGVEDGSACYAVCCKGEHAVRRRRIDSKHAHSTTTEPGREADRPAVNSTTQVPKVHFTRRRQRHHVQSTTVPEEDKHSVSSTRTPDELSTTAVLNEDVLSTTALIHSNATADAAAAAAEPHGSRSQFTRKQQQRL
eukprot:TRINITY_DN2803_c3_g1_i1.p1 TRINITY_DN2803_c3_g1~~TRINITY_DN2803_c3_g1_i1.p1  ORF type:complete len:351 (-),score=48.75 TRINITY_DN2803_c3_g1_i1:24-1010(-)